MKEQFYIDGSWQQPTVATPHPIYDPSTEEAYEEIAWGAQEDVERAVAAAKRAFQTWGLTDKQERLEILQKLASIYERRIDEMAAVISQEMGAPLDLALEAQAGSGLSHLNVLAKALSDIDFDRPLHADTPSDRIALEPIGVAAMITPWNWPMNQVTLKVGAALAAGCTMVLKPSEMTPLSSMLFAEFVHEAGVPAGVFNLVNGDGPGVGSALSIHPDIDMVSFTGSTRAGILITKAAADTVKRVALELGGKSPNLVFADSDVEAVVRAGTSFCFENAGQSCNNATRMLVERSVYDKAVKIAQETAESTQVNLASLHGDHMGPLSSKVQFDKVQGLIEKGIAEGARLIAGGSGRPENLNKGWFARPTIFADVTPDMTIYREEIFGPVLAMTPFDTEEEAIEMANDTPYGLQAYLQTGNKERAQRVARQLRAGMVSINGASQAADAPFGGYKQSGNGREGGIWGIEDFLEVKSVSGMDFD